MPPLVARVIGISKLNRSPDLKSDQFFSYHPGYPGIDQCNQDKTPHAKDNDHQTGNHVSHPLSIIVCSLFASTSPILTLDRFPLIVDFSAAGQPAQAEEPAAEESKESGLPAIYR